MRTDPPSSVACPLCDSPCVTTLTTIPTRRLIDEWARSFRIDITSQLRGHREIVRRHCTDCQLRFFTPFDVAGDGSLYEQLERLDWYYLPWTWEHAMAARRLRTGERVLEIGSGTGSFVRRLRDDLQIDAEGIELSAGAAAKARERGIPVHAISALQLAEACPASYDVVCAFQVLEHVPNPGSVVRTVIRLLRPGGRLLLGVPNQESFLGRQWNVLDLPPHHMSQWTRGVLASMERVFPLTLVATETEPLAPYHVKGFVSTYAKQYRARSLAHRLAWNRMTMLVLRGVLKAGLRRWVRGQSLFAELQRVDEPTRA